MVGELSPEFSMSGPWFFSKSPGGGGGGRLYFCSLSISVERGLWREVDIFDFNTRVLRGFTQRHDLS